MSLKIKKNDEVVVLKGKDKGKIGQVLNIVYPKKNDKKTHLRVLVKGVNIIKKHQKPSQTNQEGGIISQEAPISLANVAYVGMRTKNKATPSRIGFTFEGEKKYRIVQKTKKVIKE